MSSYRIEIVDPDPEWPRRYEELRDRALAALGDLAVGSEHVGSTSVPGLAAKPIVDLDVVIATREQLPLAIERLTALGYEYIGDLGVVSREAFRRPEGEPRHNLYVCAADSIELRRHTAFRDYLRTHPDEAAAYAELKRELAERYPYDLDAYAKAKTAFVERILNLAGN